MTNVLCICSGNTCRSVMLEGLLRQKALDRGVALHAESAGLHPSAKRKRKPSWIARACMRKRGIRIDSHRSRHVDSIDLSLFDLVIVMTADMEIEMRTRAYANRLIIVGVANPAPTRRAYRSCARRLERIAERIVGAL